MIEDYIVVKTIGTGRVPEEDEIEILEREVKEKIVDGYEPIGGIAVRHGQQSGAYFMQAMIKREVL